VESLPLRRRRDASLALAGPALLTIAVFMLLPMGIAFVYSWMTPSPYGGVEQPYTANSYLRFVYDRDLDDTLVFDTTYLTIFARSLWLAGVSTLGCALIGLPMAWYIATRGPRTRQLLVLLVTIPFWTNLLIRTYCWVLLLRDQGLVNKALMAFGLIHEPITFLYSDNAILLGLVYSSLPFMVLPIYGALEKVDPRMVEAAYDLYADRWAIMRKLVWPLAKPGVAAGTLLVFVPALGAFLQPDILGGGKRLMIGSLIQQQFTTGRDWSFGAALSMILMIFVLGALIWSALRRPRAGALA
jgi:spermidine/putrescine transport system permease protein